jgi:hypothetical protein
MADFLGIGSKFARGAPKVRVASPVLARYLDDLRFADQARELDRFYGRIPQAPGPFDNINIPEMPDPVAAERAVGAAPRSWLESADMARAMEPQPSAPLTDMLLDNERRRALISGRLDRLTPEQQARSLPMVGRQSEADRAAARAAQIKGDADSQTAGALTAAAGVGAAAFAARVAQESEANRKVRDANLAMGVDSAVRDIDIELDDEAYVGASAEDVPDLFANDTYLPVDSGVDEIGMEDQLADDVSAIRVPGSGYYIPRDDQSRAMIDRIASHGRRLQEQPFDFYDMEDRSMAAIRKMRQDRGAVGPELFTVDSLMALDLLSPEESAAAAPGPGSPVGRTMDMENLPGPQLRSIKALIGAGIPAGRAMDIITKGASMSPDEYRMVTGGRR